MVPTPRPTVPGTDNQISALIDDYYTHGVVAPEFGLNLDLNLDLNVDLNNFSFDCKFKSTELESSTALSTMLSGPVTPSQWDRNFDLESLTCSEILGLADGLIGSQQSQSGVLNVEQVATPSKNRVDKKKDKVKEKGRVPASRGKKKYQKTKEYLKPGQKRFWSKIDMEKEPKTPKSVTPKTPDLVTPKRKYTNKKNKDISEGSYRMPEHVLEKITKDELSCKRALHFENENIVGMGLDSILDVSGLQEEMPVLQIGEKLSNERVAHKYAKVYYRRLNSKCLKECKKLGINYPKACKRKRAPRDRMSFLGLKKFDGFNKFSVSLDLLDRIAIVKGKKRMIFPTKVGENALELFPCVLSLLSSGIKLNTRRRTTKRISRCPRFITGSINHQIDGRAKLYSSLDANFTDNNQAEPQVKDSKVSDTENLMHTSLQVASVCRSNIKVKASKSKVPKQKIGRPSKKKAKKSDYLSGLSDWHDVSLEQIMEPLVKHFESIDLYDNPKTIERWSLLNDNDGVNKGNEGSEEKHKKNIKWNEETKALLERIAKFIYVMTRSQGPRDFIKWRGSVLDSMIGVFLTQNVSDVLSSNAYIELASRYPLKSPNNDSEEVESDHGSSSGSNNSPWNDKHIAVIEHPLEEENHKEEEWKSKDFDEALNDMFAYLAESKGKAKEIQERENIDWDAIRVKFCGERDINGEQNRHPDTLDSVDWEAVRTAPVKDIADAIVGRGQHFIIGGKIKKTLNRLVDKHGCLDVEWLRNAPSQVAKAFLLSFYGLGLKSVECLRLLTLHHHGFPVDVNIARVSVRLGWVPLKPLPVGLPFHLLEKYPLEGDIQKYLWPRLQHLPQEILYKLHCHMITFGKVFCAKKNPNCGACPFKGECKYYTSVMTSKLELPRTQERRAIKSKKSCKKANIRNPFDLKRNIPAPLSLQTSTVNSCTEISRSYYQNDHFQSQKSCEPIIEMPPSPEPEPIMPDLPDIEDLFTNTNDDEIILELKLNFSVDLKPELYDNCFNGENICGNEELSRALVSLSPEEASMPLPKHMLHARLRTEHQVYELPDGHPLLKDFDRRDGKDLLPYLLAVWTPDQIKKVAESTEEPGCSQQIAQEESLTIPGTLLIPSRTAMRGFFPLNGTYFQVNEVFADDESSQQPIDVPRCWLWNLPKRPLYCGAGITSIFRGLTWREIQHCCFEGFVCTRGFNRKTRAPKKLHSRLHVKSKLQVDEE